MSPPPCYGRPRNGRRHRRREPGGGGWKFKKSMSTATEKSFASFPLGAPQVRSSFPVARLSCPRQHQPMSLLERAIAIAVEAHRGKKDKGGQPYILHPLRVMFLVESEDERIVAILHDVVEDHGDVWPAERLRQSGSPDHILAALDGVTRRSREILRSFPLRLRSNPTLERGIFDATSGHTEQSPTLAHSMNRVVIRNIANTAPFQGQVQALGALSGQCITVDVDLARSRPRSPRMVREKSLSLPPGAACKRNVAVPPQVSRNPRKIFAQTSKSPCA